jgi:hypothetical protein
MELELLYKRIYVFARIANMSLGNNQNLNNRIAQILDHPEIQNIKIYIPEINFREICNGNINNEITKGLNSLKEKAYTFNRFDPTLLNLLNLSENIGISNKSTIIKQKWKLVGLNGNNKIPFDNLKEASLAYYKKVKDGPQYGFDLTEEQLQSISPNNLRLAKDLGKSIIIFHENGKILQINSKNNSNNCTICTSILIYKTLENKYFYIKAEDGFTLNISAINQSTELNSLFEENSSSPNLGNTGIKLSIASNASK